MNVQEAIEKINNITAREDFLSEIILVERDEVIDIVKKLDEPKKVVIPQCVAEWLEVCKENLAIGLFVAITPNVLEVNNQSAETIYWLRSARNQEIFAKAWIYGYEVEKEKLYTVELPNPNQHNGKNIVLVKKENGICIDCYYNNYYKKLDRARLTEAEIKKDFEWAWRFAKEYIER